MNRVATNVKVIELKRGGHWLMEERPKETMDELVGFLRLDNFRIDTTDPFTDDKCNSAQLNQRLQFGKRRCVHANLAP